MARGFKSVQESVVTSGCVQDTVIAIMGILEDQYIVLSHFDYAVSLIGVGAFFTLAGILVGMMIRRKYGERVKILPVLWG